MRWFRQKDRERDLERELRSDLELEIEEQQAKGLSPEDAHYAARQAFGNATFIQEEIREMRPWIFLERVGQDLRYAFRQLRKSKGFAITAILSLALGIGANTAIFTLIDAVLLRSLPVKAPHELVSVGDPSRPMALRHGGLMADIFSYPLYERLRDQNKVFSGLLASGQAGPLDMSTDGGGPERVHGRLVSGNYFEVLGVSPVLGRTFSVEDRAQGANPVIVISYDYWINRFAHNPGILGRNLKLNGSPFTIIGVAPAQFTGDVVGTPSDIWIPLSMQPQVNRGSARLDQRDTNWLLLIGRLKPGISLARARAEITTLVHETLIDYSSAHSPDERREIRSKPVYVQPGAKGFSFVRKRVSRPLMTLMVAVCLVLLIACANITNLLLARATARQREISVRLAVGASRWRLIRQLITESVLLGALGGVLGLLLAWGGSRVLLRLAASGPDPIMLDVRPNLTVFAFTLAVSGLTGLLFGLVPAWQATRVDLLSTLKESARHVSPGKWPLSKLLVTGQIAFSLLLLVGAGLFLQSIVNLETTDVGYSRVNLALLQIDPAASGYGTPQQLSLMRSLVERLRSVPGVRDVTVSENGVFAGIDTGTDSLQVEGFTPTRKEDLSCSADQVGPRYFQILGVPLLAGREFDERDHAGAPLAAVLNESMARFYFGHSNPIGKHILNGNDRYTIVGVARDVRDHKLKGKIERRLYASLWQTTDRINPIHFEVRTQTNAAPVIPSIRREVQSFDRNLKVLRLTPVRLLMTESVSDDRLLAQLCGIFGVLGLFLASTGLYGIMAYATAQRTQEIGLRMALGAQRSEVARLVLQQGLVLTAVGIVAGIGMALWLSCYLRSQLYAVSPLDPGVYAIVAATLGTVALLACSVPARRATKVDPMVALRHE
jgi:predicted permease